MKSKYIEKDINWLSSAIILLAAFVVIYTPLQLGSKELSTREGYYAAMAVEDVPDSTLPVAVAQGEVISGYYPLYPTLASFVDKTGMPMELNLRLISVMTLLVITITAWIVGRRAISPQAGIVSAAMMISTALATDKCVDGYPDILACLFVFWGWMAWFTFGAVKRKWSMAWIVSSAFCGLAFYSIGWFAVLCFILPFIFLRRPLTIWRKLKSSGIIVSITVVVLFVLLWAVPMWIISGEMHMRESSLEILSFGEYLTHLYKYPFDVVSKFMPWSFVAWAPFCVALYRMDENLLFSRYLRTIVISLFFFMWLNPFYDSRDLLFIAAPLAVLTGSHYWILVRRYTRQYYYVFRIVSLTVIILSSALIGFYLMPDSWFDLEPYFGRGLHFKDDFKILGIVKLSVAFLIALYFFLLEHRNIVLWRHMVGLVVAIALCNWGFATPYRAQTTMKHRFAERLKDAIMKEADYSKDLIVYKDANIRGLYSECYYLGCKVKRIHSLDELPQSQKNIYLLSTRTPFIPGRKTSNLLPQGYKYKKITVYLWKGVLEDEATRNDN